MEETTHKSDENIGQPTMQKSIATANEFISNNMENCIHIWKDDSHYTSLLTVSIAEDPLLQNGLLVNAGFIDMVQISVHGAGVNAADQTTGTARAATFVQKAINDAVRQAKINNRNYAIVHMDLSEFDKEYPWLYGKKKVLNMELEFVMLDTVQYG